MALNSQSTRSAVSRKYMTSKGKRSKAPWLVLLVVAAVVVGGYAIFFAGDKATSPEQANAQGGHTPEIQNAGAAGDSGSAGANGGGQGTAGPSGNYRPGGDPGTRQSEYDIRSPDEATRRFTGPAREQYEQGLALIEDGNLVAGRAQLSELLFREGDELPRHEARAIRERLTHINQELVFSPRITEGDPIVASHMVQRGEYLGRDIAPTFNVPSQFLERINNVEAPRLQADRPIKCIRGPIHARVVKHDYRMDLFVEDPEGLRIYLCSYPVGLGEDDSTPAGLWCIKSGSKVKDPDWRDDLTNEYFSSDDPNNPIGDYWMELQGIDDNTREYEGYGIHGTVDLASIGQQESRGCIRMRPQYVEEVFNMLVGGHSRVEVIP